MHREQFDSIVRQVESIFGAKSSKHLIEENWMLWRNKPVDKFLEAIKALNDPSLDKIKNNNLNASAFGDKAINK